MLKILIWHVSNDTRRLRNALKILEQQHDGIEIVGEALNEDIAKVDGGGDYDLILVVGAKKMGMSEVTHNAAQLNLPEEKLLGDWIVCIPGFTLEKYRRLQRSHLSIISINCFGGIVSRTLGLPFRSPLVNLFIPQKDFIKFLRKPHDYLEEPLLYKDKRFVEAGNYSYPIAKLGDISVHMMHYKTFEEAVEAWENRKKRINWFNLFVEMFIIEQNKPLLEQFDALPYGKKVCFVPFESDLDSAWYVDPKIDKKTERIDFAVNHLAYGNVFRYDLFDMLLYGKKTPLIDM